MKKTTVTGGGLITPAARVHASKEVQTTTGGGLITPAVRVHATK